MFVISFYNIVLNLFIIKREVGVVVTVATFPPIRTSARWLPIYVNARTSCKVIFVSLVILSLYCDNTVVNITWLQCMCSCAICYDFSMVINLYVQYCVRRHLKCSVLSCDYYLCSDSPMWTDMMLVVGWYRCFHVSKSFLSQPNKSRTRKIQKRVC